MLKIIFILGVGLFLISCSFLTDVNLHPQAREKYFAIYTKKVEQKKESVEKYVGKSADILKLKMGAPTKILNHSALRGISYEEEWIYYYERGVPLINSSSYSINFYIEDGIVKAVDILGMPFE